MGSALFNLSNIHSSKVNLEYLFARHLCRLQRTANFFLPIFHLFITYGGIDI